MARTSKLVGIMFGVGMGVFAVGLTVFFAIYLWPKGERVGQIDLRAASPSLEVDGAPGDALSFRLDVALGTAALPTSRRGRDQAMHDGLRGSTLALSIPAADGSARTAKCAGYDGRAMSSSGTTSVVEISGIPVVCTFTLDRAGRHRLDAKVAWASGLDVRSATLEVRREPAKKK